MKWRLGLDVGTNSLGWVVYEIIDGHDGHGNFLGKPRRLVESGVRIFSDSRSKKAKTRYESLAIPRRGARGARRNRDRYLRRRAEFMDRLVEYGLMPEDKTARKALETLDPWALRVRGLDEELSLHELGRALFHLQQRRGFKSNRKTDKGDKDTGAIKDATNKLIADMKKQSARTVGEFLARDRVDDPKMAAVKQVRARPTSVKNKNTYDFYPTRKMIEEEFNALWDKQKEFHGDALSQKAKKALGDRDTGTLFFQRPLKPQPVGKCTLDPDQQRAPKALPSVQALRIYQEVNHLRLRLPGQAERPLTVEERNKIADKLLSVGKLSFDSMRHLIKHPGVIFSHESKKRKHLDGDKTAAILAQKPSAKVSGRWGPQWRDLPREQQDAIVEILIGMEPAYSNDKPNPAFEPLAQGIAATLDMPVERAKKLLSANDEKAIIDWLVQDFGFDETRAASIANVSLPDGHGGLGRAVTAKVLPWLMSDAQNIDDPDPKKEALISAPFTYDQSVRLGGYDSHSSFDDGEVFDQLPYYGEVLGRSVAFGTGEPDDIIEKRIGKLANPTVHVAMNQIRKVVNSLAKRYGTPTEIVVEIARDLPLSAKGKKDLEKLQSDNQKTNERRAKELENHNQTNTYDNRMRMRLWEELNENEPHNRCCVYTGEQIGIERLFSAEVEIEHILPRSKTLDDSFSNKTLSMREANRLKKQDTPFEAFGLDQHAPKYKWDAISQRADNLPNNKSWRFGPDAMERYEDEEKGFLARQLGDTRYIARLTREYMSKMAGRGHVWVVTGQMTSDLRHAWGLNSVLAGHNRMESEAEDVKKNRNDHRHHALDAVVIGLIDRALLQKVATAAGRAEQRFSRNWAKDWPDPWTGFRDDVIRSMEKITISHKADHGVEGELHEGTNYGVVADPVTGEPRLASRKALTALTEPEMTRIGDLKIRAELEERMRDIDDQGLPNKDRTKEIIAMLAEYGKETSVRRVRVHKVQADYETIRHNGHQKAVIPGENYCVDLVQTTNGKWHGVGVTRFAANRQKRLGATTPLWKQQYPDAQHIMRVRKGDLLMLEKDGREQVMVVVQLHSSANRFFLVGHTEAGTLNDRHKDKDDLFRWDMASFSKLKDRKARLVYVDPAGKVHDPGPPS